MAVAGGGHPATPWTGRFVRVYERLRSGFQFSPIIFNDWASRQDLPEHYSFYHFPSSFLSLSLSLLPVFSSPFRLALFLSFTHSFSPVAVFSVSRLPELFQSPTWEDLSSAPTFWGSPITSCRYYRRERGVLEEKGALAENGTLRTAVGGIPFPGFMDDARRARMHVTRTT